MFSTLPSKPFFPPPVAFFLLLLHDMNTAPPPSKKPRTESNAPACSYDDSMPPVFFLDSFPKEFLSNVLKFFSRSPAVKDWVPHVPLGSIIELYGVTGERVKFMKPRFNTLCISKSFKSYDENDSCNWKRRKGSILWTQDLDVARRFVLAGGGSSLHAIIIGKGIYGRDDGTEIIDDFMNSCPNVTSLSIEDERGVWVSKFGGQLEELEMVTESYSAISRTSANLRELHLSLES